MTAVQSLASEMSTYFVLAHERGGIQYPVLDGNCPGWMRKAWLESQHCGFTDPIQEGFRVEQFRCRFLKLAVDAIAANEDFQEACEAFADSRPIHPQTLTDWLNSDCDHRLWIVDDVTEHYGPFNTLSTLLSRAYRQEMDDMFNRLIVRLVERAKGLAGWDSVEV
jgi:hypothetical protein